MIFEEERRAICKEWRQPPKSKTVEIYIQSLLVGREGHEERRIWIYKTHCVVVSEHGHDIHDLAANRGPSYLVLGSHT